MQIPELLRNSRRNRTDLMSDCVNVAELVARIHEEYTEYRLQANERAVTKNYKEAYRQHLELIILDLLSAWEGDPTKYVGYSRGSENYRRGGSYWNSETDTNLISEDIYRRLVNFMADVGYVENHTADAGYTEISSRMRALPDLIEHFVELGLNWTCIQSRADHPSIIVKDRKKKIIPWPKSNGFDVDQAVTNLNRINANLQSTHLNLNITDDAFHDLLNRMRGNDADDLDGGDGNPDYREPFEFSNRRLRRIFGHGQFQVGGRFYGGWWQGIPSEYRKFIEIDGHPTVEMDFSTMQARTIYAWEGLEPPEDSYLLPEWDEKLRPIIKKAFQWITNCSPKMKRRSLWEDAVAPDLTPVPCPDDWKELGAGERVSIQRQLFLDQTGRDYSELLEALLELHRPIEKWCFQKNWGAVQAVDSRIAEQIMIRLLDQPTPVTTLPIHDSFVVPYKDKDLLLDTMLSVFEEVQEQKCRVDTDISVFDPPEGFDPNSPPFMTPEENEKYSTEYAAERLDYFKRQFQWMQYKSGGDDIDFSPYYDGRLVPDPRFWMYFNNSSD